MFGITTITALGLVGLAAAIFAETGLFIGVVLPGDTLLFSFGILASLGKVSLIGVIVVAAISAYLGYDFAYRLGKKYGERVFSREKGIFAKKNLERSHKYFALFGALTILFSRFIPGVRVIAGAMAGVVVMPRRKFVLYNLIGAILWPITTVLLGYYFGKQIDDPDKYILPIIASVTVISFLFPFLVKLFKKKKTQKTDHNLPK